MLRKKPNFIDDRKKLLDSPPLRNSVCVFIDARMACCFLTLLIGKEGIWGGRSFFWN
jgi:hypothetical protein